MSRILSPVFVLMLIISLTGCGDDTVGGNGTPDGDEVAFECLNSSDCDTAEICIEHSCLKYCSSEITCDKGLCDTALHACIVEDNDGDADGDASSGNCNIDGCSDGYYCHVATGVCIPTSDGDEDGDAEGGTDGDSEICPELGCAELYEIDEETCTCVPGSEHCINAGCSDDKVCNEESGLCEDNSLWPGMCRNCYSDSDCPAEGSVCSRVLETQEHFCSPSCRSTDPICPEDSTCTDVSSYMGLSEPCWVCLPADNTCGNPHLTGGACAADADCSEELYCITEADNDFNAIFPSGYCSRLCEDDDGCLSGSRCTGITVDSEMIKTCMTLCTHLDNDCRSGYTCVDVPDSRAVCVPDDLANKD